MRYRVRHSTEYRYSAQVINGHTVAHLRPRETPTQIGADRRRSSRFPRRITPTSTSTRSATMCRTAPSSRCTTNWRWLRSPRSRSLRRWTLLWSPPWEEVRSIVATDGSPDGLVARMCSIESTFVTPSADLARFASWSFLPGRPFHEAVIDLSHRIFAEFAFDPGFSDVSTPLADVLTFRRGVCQDFAHLAIGTMRSLGLPARYVSGYVENEPSPGEPKMVGADASHAWCSVYIPGWGWLDVDPTNDQVPPRSHVTVGWGRDYADVAPVRGVVFGSPATQELVVAVEVTRLDA